MLAESAGRREVVTPIAGGTDVMVSWHHREKNGLTLLDLSRVRELAVMNWNVVGGCFDQGSGGMGVPSFDLRRDAGASPWLELGGLTTYWDVMQSREAAAAYPLLGEAARQVGAVQIQTRGTWAGNIGNGSPAADGVPVLMAYDARVVLASVRGRREVRLDEFYTGYRTSVRAADELIVAIRLPPPAWDVQWFHKVGARRAQAITKVGVALSHGANGWRVVANSVAPTVVRCRALEASLDAGRTFTGPPDIESLLTADISPIDDMRSTAAYRRRVLARLIFFRLAECA
ncbi:MAG: hypothetical protein DCC66_01890 [Planctomycetota bacterium]|nr:MAG: hypothetical protein DCC66_01890 [Planctomycetota bacterium]